VAAVKADPVGQESDLFAGVTKEENA
jgi:hypothetical protein